jgi:hypothetical protein
MKAFRAYRIHEAGKFGEGRFDAMSRAELDTGAVGRQVVDFSLG